MGLDVSLYERKQAEQSDKHWAEWEALFARKEAGELTDEEWDVQRKLITPDSDRTRDAEVKSDTNPEHMFTRRYLRSSYNSGGFNSVAENFGGHDLYWIFEPLQMDFEDVDGWLREDDIEGLRLCRERALQVADEIANWDRIMVAEFHGPILGDAAHLWDKLPTKEQVLEWGREELTKEKNDLFGSGGYSTAKGSVFSDGFELLAITLGEDRYAFGRAPVTAYGIYKSNDENTAFYEEAARITAEFCEEAIALIQRDGSVQMSWSG